MNPKTFLSVTKRLILTLAAHYFYLLCRKRTVALFPDAVYIDSGVKTSRFDLANAKNGDELINAIGENLRLNA